MGSSFFMILALSFFALSQVAVIFSLYYQLKTIQTIDERINIQKELLKIQKQRLDNLLLAPYELEQEDPLNKVFDQEEKPYDHYRIYPPA